MLLIVLFCATAVLAVSQSCFHTNACFAASNFVAFARCKAAGGQVSDKTCCDSFCTTHPESAGCSDCPAPSCAASSVFCPVTVLGVRPQCTPNTCESTGKCRFGRQDCSATAPCPCVCDGHSNVDCTASPNAPSVSCSQTFHTDVLYNDESQRCVRDTCIKVPGARRGHAFWDHSIACVHDDDLPCVAEHTGDKCVDLRAVSRFAVLSVPSCPVSMICESNPDDYCVSRTCNHPEDDDDDNGDDKRKRDEGEDDDDDTNNEFGTCSDDENTICRTDADCGCACASSGESCSEPPSVCPDYICPKTDIDRTCIHQSCRVAFNMTIGACTHCGSPCETDADCLCVCQFDLPTKCTLVTPSPTTSTVATTSTEATTATTVASTSGSTASTTDSTTNDGTTGPPTDSTASSTATLTTTTTTVASTASTTAAPCNLPCPLQPGYTRTDPFCSNIVPTDNTVDNAGFCSDNACTVMFFINGTNDIHRISCGTTIGECSVPEDDQQPCTCLSQCLCEYGQPFSGRKRAGGFTPPPAMIHAYSHCGDAGPSTTTTPTATTQTTTTIATSPPTPAPIVCGDVCPDKSGFNTIDALCTQQKPNYNPSNDGFGVCRAADDKCVAKGLSDNPDIEFVEFVCANSCGGAGEDANCACDTGCYCKYETIGEFPRQRFLKCNGPDQCDPWQTSTVISAASTITCTNGPTGFVTTGDISLVAGTSITGFGGIPCVSGVIHNNDIIALTNSFAVAQLFIDVGLLLCTTSLGATIYSVPTTLTPGVYCYSASLLITSVLTLDAGGNPNAQWVFRMASSTLTTGAGSSIVLFGDARATNVVWHVGSSATLGAGSTFVGTIIAVASISLDDDVTVVGRLHALTAAVTIQGGRLDAPADSPCNTPTPTPTSPPLVCCKVVVGGTEYECSATVTALECSDLGGTEQTTFGGPNECLDGCVTPTFNTPCCSKYDSMTNTVSCTARTTICEDGETTESMLPSDRCDADCNPVLDCCGSFSGSVVQCSRLPPEECLGDPYNTGTVGGGPFCDEMCNEANVCCVDDFTCQSIAYSSCISNDGTIDSNFCVQPGCGTPTGCCIVTDETGVSCQDNVDGAICNGEGKEWATGDACCPTHSDVCTSCPTSPPVPTTTQDHTTPDTTSPEVCSGTCPTRFKGLQSLDDFCGVKSPAGICTDFGSETATCYVQNLNTDQQSVCAQNAKCNGFGNCDCETTLCGCQYYDGAHFYAFLACNDIPATTAPSTAPTTAPTTASTTASTQSTTASTTASTLPITTAPHTESPTTTGPTNVCDELENPIRCGVRPGCVDGPRDGDACHTSAQCEGYQCVPMEHACQINEPCTNCEVTSGANSVRNCGVCLYCTQEEMDAQQQGDVADFAFECCPVLPGQPIVNPVPPTKKCIDLSGSPSDCARKYDCMCRARPCEDRHDISSTECAAPVNDICDATVIAPPQAIGAKIACTNGTPCANAKTLDYYLVNVTDGRVLRIVMTNSSAILVLSISQVDVGCNGSDAAPTYTLVPVVDVGDTDVTYEYEVPAHGVYIVTVSAACPSIDAFTCLSYKLHFTTMPPLCRNYLCQLPSCLSSMDCTLSSSCWACDRRWSRCVERANCTTSDCLAAGEPIDTCVGAIENAPCVKCNGNGCQFGGCVNQECSINDELGEFDCDCRCERSCRTTSDCAMLPQQSRFCDQNTGTCVYRDLPLPEGPSSLAASSAPVRMTESCTSASLDASERGFTAYAMDRFGAFDWATGTRRPALCAGSIETDSITVDPTNIESSLQARCCSASTDWHAMCLDGATNAVNSGHFWADRAWLMMHQAHSHAQQGHTTDAAAHACCASLLWAALGKACGRTTDVWGLADTVVVRNDKGPSIQAYEDGFGDGDTNDFVVLVRQAEVRRESGELIAVNTHTEPLARGGGFQASFGLAYGVSGAFPTHRVDESSVCPERERRLAHAVLDQTATKRQLQTIQALPAGSFAGVIRHVIRSTDGKLPERIVDAECQTLSGTGTVGCPASTAFVALYADTASAMPYEAPSVSEQLAARVAYRERVVNTQSGTKYWAPRYAVSSVLVASQPGAQSVGRFVLRNHDCGVSILMDDKSTANAPLAITVPPEGAHLWRWATEGTRLLQNSKETSRTCRSGPLSGTEICTNDAVCNGGYCDLPPAKVGVPYPYALQYYECKARGVTCDGSANEDSDCCIVEVQRWYLAGSRSADLVYEPLNE